MARRRSGLRPVHIISAASVLLLGGGGIFAFSRKSETGLTGNQFSVSEYLRNHMSMRGNQYLVTGTITSLESYGKDSSRLFAMDVKDESSSAIEPIGVLVPARFSSVTIQTGQQFQMKVTIDAKGVPVVDEIRKS